jgi:hypothetical protein
MNNAETIRRKLGMEHVDIIHKMVTALGSAGAQRPKSYATDLLYDGLKIGQSPVSTQFAWFVGDCGTHIAYDAEMFECIAENVPSYDRYFWNGRDLIKIVSNPFID